MKMSREDFVEGFNEAVEEVDTPDCEFNKLIVEGKEMADGFADHDPILAALMEDTVKALSRVQTYIRQTGKIS